MKLFSFRNGYSKVKVDIQNKSMDQDLKVDLWNNISLFIWNKFKYQWLYEDETFHSFIKVIWMYFYKKTLDTLDEYWRDTYGFIRTWYFKAEWYEVYDFLEFLLRVYPYESVTKDFKKAVEVSLEVNLSAYRFIGNSITEITSEKEIQEIENAVNNSPAAVQKHLQKSLKLLSNKKNPDYRNSIKESINAVEAICQLVTGDKKTTLGSALNKIEQDSPIKIHKALKKAFKSLYGYTSNADGIRHALLEKETLSYEDSIFMLIACSAFINYIRVKADKATIKLD